MKHLTLLGLVSAFLCLAAAALAAPVPSFIYDGQPADLYIYNRSSEGDQNTDEYFSVIDRFTTPDGRLQVEMYRKHYKRFPVVEYSVTLKNLSDDQPTAIIENFKSYDGTVELPAFGQSVELNIIRGSVCAPEDFAREFSTLAKGESRAFRTPSGRSSNDCMPFLETSFDAYNGLIVAVGWTGAWAADIENTGDALHITAGMDKTRFYLKPGETIRQPSITLFTREGIGRRAFKTVVHRFMLDCKVPRRADGTLHQPILPITAGGGNKTPEMMLDIINYALENKIPFDTFWIDAGWYGPARQLDPLPNCSTDWYQYVGDWTFNTTTNPAGNFRKISDAVHRANMRFLVWFEPERVAEAPIRQEHPEYIHDNLLDYGQDAALEWIQNAVYSVIEDSKIDIYRQDFNMEPGPVWAKMDESDPDRVGIAEARHVAGLYKFLDDMRARFPDIMQENCASGGRRIDIEMISRVLLLPQRLPDRAQAGRYGVCDEPKRHPQHDPLSPVPGERNRLCLDPRRLRDGQLFRRRDGLHADRLQRCHRRPSVHRSGNRLVPKIVRLSQADQRSFDRGFLSPGRRNHGRRRLLGRLAVLRRRRRLRHRLPPSGRRGE